MTKQEFDAALVSMCGNKTYADSLVRDLGERGLRIVPAEPVAEYTTGHCARKKAPGGCQLHNLQCGYPNCDRKKTENKS